MGKLFLITLALHTYSFATELQLAVSEGHWQKVERLLEGGANIHEKDKEGRTLLMDSVSKNIERDGAQKYSHLKTMEVLLDKKADMEAKDKFGWTALMIASTLGRLEKVKMLLDRGAHIEAKAHSGWTALVAASYCGNLEVAKELLKHGADISVVTKYNSSPVCAAANNGFKDVMELLRQASFKRSIRLSGRDIALLERDGLGTVDGYNKRFAPKTADRPKRCRMFGF